MFGVSENVPRKSMKQSKEKKKYRDHEYVHTHTNLYVLHISVEKVGLRNTHHLFYFNKGNKLFWVTCNEAIMNTTSAHGFFRY